MKKKKPNLDDQFGVCIDPGRVHPCETTHTPASLFRLELQGAKKLRALMRLVEGGFYLSHCLFTEFNLLWVINKNGEVILGLEEGVTEATKSGFPLPRAFLANQSQKLGHPALVRCKPARIGGELVFDPTEPGGSWVLSNKSGRFGLTPDRRPEHLDNVVSLFQKNRIAVTPLFLSPG
jgi:hypothetical protein